MHLLHSTRRTLSVAIVSVLFGATLAAGCYHPALVAGALPVDKSSTDSAMKVVMKTTQRCNGYYLLVENALPRAVEIYEVGQHMSERLVAYAQIGYTEVPMTESSQQFVAMSRGELMAAATNTDQRAGDRVALSRSCRPF